MVYGTPEWIRTTDLLLRRQTLYPAELRAHIQVSQDGLVPIFALPFPCISVAKPRCDDSGAHTQRVYP
jgi:hypothetical protein